MMAGARDLGTHLRQVRPHRRGVRGTCRAARAGSSRGVSDRPRTRRAPARRSPRRPGSRAQTHPEATALELPRPRGRTRAAAARARPLRVARPARGASWGRCRRACGVASPSTRWGVSANSPTRSAVLEREIRGLMRGARPRTAGHPRLLGYRRGASDRPDGRRLSLRGEAAFAMHDGRAPLPVSSGKSSAIA